MADRDQGVQLAVVKLMQLSSVVADLSGIARIAAAQQLDEGGLSK